MSAYPMQDAGYPPQDPGYPPENPGYPAQNPEYPPPAQNPGYPAQNPENPPPAQNPGYPAQNPEYPGYPPQESYPADPTKQPPPPQQGFSSQAAPPSYYSTQQQGYPPQQQQGYPPQQQQGQNVVVVTQQPHQPVVVNRQHADVGNGAMIFAIVMTFLAFFFGCWWALPCTIPAIILALNAQSAGNRGDIDSARTNEKYSMGCSVTAIVFGVIGLVALIGGLIYWYINIFSFSFNSFRG